MTGYPESEITKNKSPFYESHEETMRREKKGDERQEPGRKTQYSAQMTEMMGQNDLAEIS
jgi:hypothetical protein